MADLRKLAEAARGKAHAPYSNFHVGVALETNDGLTFSGANMENASYPEGWCAETTAIAHMQMAAPGSRIKRVLVLGQGDGVLTPCGGCRQRLSEFSGADTQVECTNLKGDTRTFRMDELLPAAFDLDPSH